MRPLAPFLGLFQAEQACHISPSELATLNSLLLPRYQPGILNTLFVQIYPLPHPTVASSEKPSLILSSSKAESEAPS